MCLLGRVRVHLMLLYQVTKVTKLNSMLAVFVCGGVVSRTIGTRHQAPGQAHVLVTNCSRFRIIP